MNSIWSLNEAVDLAFLGEKQVLRSVSRGVSTWKPSASELNKPGPSNASNFFYKKPQEAIQGGDKLLPSKPSNPYARPTVGKCFRCNQLRHRSNECPTIPQAHLLDVQTEVDDFKEQFEEASERLSLAILDGDEGDPLLCVLERLILVEPCQTQRNSIF